MSKDEYKSRRKANEQLMPCPFCGGKARVIDHVYFKVPRTYEVVCLNGECGASSQSYNTIGEAVAAWNKRAVPAGRGQWKPLGDGKIEACSNCGYQILSIRKTNFCPNCGADMRGEKDE